MGWLFGKKKIVPKVPFPEGRGIDKNSLQLPQKSSREKVILPDQVKAAVGLEQSEPIPQQEETLPTQTEQNVEMPPFSSQPETKIPEQKIKKQVNVKVNTYRNILTELNELKKNAFEFNDINKKLELSEYNEEKDISRMKKSTKSMHDRLLQIDKIIFKGE